MYLDLTTALAGIKTMTEFTALAAKSKTDSAVAEKARELTAVIIDLQSAILSIQTQNQELLQRNHELEQKIADIENWSMTASKYKLKEIALGVFVYSNEENVSEGEPSHWLCTNCYENKQKSILQRGRRDIIGTHFFCARCKADIACNPGWFGNKG